MADASVQVLRDEVNRRFGKIEKTLNEVAQQISELWELDESVAKQAHNELSQARREDRDANAEVVEQGVGQAADVARSEVVEAVSAVREELRVWFDSIGDAFKGSDD